MNTLQNKISDSLSVIRNRYSHPITMALILGTGLNEIANALKNPVIIPYKDIPHFQRSTAPSHKGRLLLGEWEGAHVAIQQGRLHLYEGYTGKEVCYPLLVMHALGASRLIVTNACGSLNKDFTVGDLVIIKDHINLTGQNPLVGQNDDSLGIRFPSLHDAYTREYRKKIQKLCTHLHIQHHTGIYAGLLGPTLETPAECEMLHRLGADMVGMSTVTEVITAVYLNMKVLGISTITNLSNLFHQHTHNQAEIESAARIAQKNLTLLLQAFIKEEVNNE